MTLHKKQHFDIHDSIWFLLLEKSISAKDKKLYVYRCRTVYNSKESERIIKLPTSKKYSKGKSINIDKLKRYQSTQKVKNNCYIAELVQIFSEENYGFIAS